MNYLVKLDTNGSDPEVLKKLIEQKLVDYIAMDLKGRETFGKSDEIIQSVELIIDSNIKYHFRTTMVTPGVSCGDVADIVIYLMRKGVKKYILQQCIITDQVLNPEIFDGIRQWNEDEIKNNQNVIDKYLKKY